MQATTPKRRDMTYEIVFGDGEGPNRFNSHRCSVAEHSVFGATGGSEESATTYQTAEDQDHERIVSECSSAHASFGGTRSRSTPSNHEVVQNVDGKDVYQEWQPGARGYRTVYPDWSYTEGSRVMPYFRITSNDETSQSQPITPYYDQHSHIRHGLSSEPWDPLGLPHHRTGIQHACNTAPVINIEPPNDESRVAGLSCGGASVLGSCNMATTSTWQGFCVGGSQGRMDGQSALRVSPCQRRSRSSVASAWRRSYGRTPGCTPTSAEAYGRPYPNNLSNGLRPQRGQQDLVTPTSAPVSLLATNMSRVSSSQGEEQRYCPEFDCNANFRGQYANGSLARHRRLKHSSLQGQEEREYDCEEPGCSKSYKRQDARVKHYRKHHVHLAPGPAQSRKKSRFV